MTFTHLWVWLCIREGKILNLSVIIGTWVNANSQWLRIPLCSTRQNGSSWKSGVEWSFGLKLFHSGPAGSMIASCSFTLFLAHIWNKCVWQLGESPNWLPYAWIKSSYGRKSQVCPLELSLTTKIANYKKPYILNYRDQCYIKDAKGSGL